MSDRQKAISRSLDRSSTTPLYQQIERILREELIADTAQRLTESDLVGRFQVSRFTVRQALAQLVAEGLVNRHQRRGTYPTTAGPIEQPLSGVYSFVESMRELGLSSSSKVLSLRTVLADEALRDQLLLSDSVEVLELTRLRLVEDAPLILEKIWLPAVRVPGLAELDLTGSVYELLQRVYGLRISSARESIRPVVLDGRQASLLDSKPGTAAFFVERVSSAGATPLEVRHNLIRGDRYLFSVQLRPFQSR